ncbi:APC family permease [Opitutus sp. GAS368]|uniref:APC family permease n=1 Tax=Opitutus sp. GAS368 TaxID=1882749 RepID=UPI00087B9764|nr:APC family permease [Opitutus sp. GAS368]SDS03699.1 amino acid/polyamine/organocation transporter, APC superfamily [Opitutus sp. GAS368]
MTAPTQPRLVRALGRWTMVGLVINSVIGSAAFGLPGDLVRFVGNSAPWAYVLAAGGIALFMGVFAELGSQFSEAGGPYLFAREGCGRFWGIQMGWFIWLVRLTSAAANANLFVVYLGEFWPGVTATGPRIALLGLLLGGLVLANIRSVGSGARLSNFLTVAKLTPLALLILAGFLWTGAPVTQPPVAATSAGWMNAVLALLFAFGGFEAALMPLAEGKDPRRDLPFALFTGLLVIASCLLLTQIVAMRTVPNLAGSARPLADAARALVGPAGAGFIALGAMISTSGYLSAQLLGVPRQTYAMAERGDFPASLGGVHPRFRTPWISILLWGVLVLALAIYGNFIWNAIISAGARLITYGIACVALIRLRRLRPHADAFRLPAGPVIAVAGLVLCAVLVAQMSLTHAVVISLIATIGLVNWLLVRGNRP